MWYQFYVRPCVAWPTLQTNALPLFSITPDSLRLRWNMFPLIFFSNWGGSTTPGLLDLFPVMKRVKQIQKFFGNNSHLCWRHSYFEWKFIPASLLNKYNPRFRYLCTDSVRHSGAGAGQGGVFSPRGAGAERPAFPFPLLWRHSTGTHSEQVLQGCRHGWHGDPLHHDNVCTDFNQHPLHRRGHWVQHTAGASSTGATGHHILPNTGTSNPIMHLRCMSLCVAHDALYCVQHGWRIISCPVTFFCVRKAQSCSGFDWSNSPERVQ